MENKTGKEEGKNSRWDNLKTQNIPEIMQKIEPEYKVWCNTAQYRKEDSIWGKFAKASLRSNDFLDRLWLYTWWKRSKEMQEKFVLNSTHVDNLPNQPIRTSSPKTDRKSSCICNVSHDNDELTMVECMICGNKFHCACLRIDSKKVKSKIKCPKCTARPNKRTVDVPSFVQAPKTDPPIGNFDVSSISGEEDNGNFVPSSHETAVGGENEGDNSVDYGQADNSFAAGGRHLTLQNSESWILEDDRENPAGKSHLDSYFWRDPNTPENAEGPYLPQVTDTDRDESFHTATSSTLSFGSFDVGFLHSDSDDMDKSDNTVSKVQNFSQEKLDYASEIDVKAEEAETGRKFKTDDTQNSPIKSHSNSSDFLPSKKKEKRSAHKSEKEIQEAKPEDIPKEFTLEIPYKKWKKFIVQSEWDENSKDGISKIFKLANGWTNLIRKYFKEVNPYCVVNFKRHRFNPQPSARDKRFALHSYFHASGSCKHPNCFQFKIRCKNQPEKKSNVLFNVSSIGKFCHHDGDMFANQIRYDERTKIKKQLKHRRAAAVGTSLNCKANMAAVRLGNYSSVPDRHVLRQARYEVLQKDALATDVFEDLRLKVAKEQEGEKEHRFIRHLSVKPCVVVYFSQRQLELMQMVKEKTGELVGHLDSTGSLFKKLPEYCGKKKPLMYSMVINNPIRGCPPLPVLEFVINKHSAKAISQPLEIHKEKFQKILGLSKRENLFTRIETDFSIAMIEAALQTYADVGIKEYLNKCWLVLFFDDRPFKTNFHVCRSHVSKAVLDQARGFYGKDDPRVRTIKSILLGFWKSCQFGSVYYRAKNLLLLCGSEYLTPSVQTVVDKCEERTPPEIQAQTDLWQKFDVRGANMKNIYKFTAFGMYFHNLWDEVRIEAENESAKIISKKNLAENPYYNVPFVKYLLRNVLPYVPLLTHIMFESSGDWRKQDHQAAVEIYNRIVKTDEHGSEHRLKLGIFVTKVKKMMIGRCNAFETDWLRNKPTVKKFKLPKPLQKEIVSSIKLEKEDEGKLAPVAKIPKQKVEKTVESKETKENLEKNQQDTFEEKSVSDFRETWRKRGEQVAARVSYLHFFKALPFIPWGDKVKEKSNYNFTNTCTLDNSIMAIYALYTWFSETKLYISREREKGSKEASTLEKVVSLVHDEKFNSAKAVWLQDLKRIELSSSKSNDIFGTEIEISLNALRPLLEKFISIERCSNPVHGTINQHRRCLSDIDGSTILDKVHKINNETFIRGAKCVFDSCPEKIVQEVIETTKGGLPFIIFISDAESSVLELPATISIKGTNYDLFCASLNQAHRNHFVSVYPIGQQWYYYDGMRPMKEDGTGGFQLGLPEKYSTVNLAWYVKQ